MFNAAVIKSSFTTRLPLKWCYATSRAHLTLHLVDGTVNLCYKISVRAEPQRTEKKAISGFSGRKHSFFSLTKTRNADVCLLAHKPLLCFCVRRHTGVEVTRQHNSVLLTPRRHRQRGFTVVMCLTFRLQAVSSHAVFCRSSGRRFFASSCAQTSLRASDFFYFSAASQRQQSECFLSQCQQ